MSIRSLIRSVFFGNYFYGICAVGLSIEASLQQRYPIQDPTFYIAIFSLTTWYYTIAYITERSEVGGNQRTNWYIRNGQFVKVSQFILLATFLLASSFLCARYWENLFQMTLPQFLLASIFPLVAVFYYGINSRFMGNYSLRNIGWMKPFIIGFTWAGLATVYPILVYKFAHREDGTLALLGWLLFVKNFMFVTVLCIMFDIKDYAMDYNHHLKTFVVKNGLRNTIFYILIPLSIAGLGCFLLYGISHHFSSMKILLNTIPFISMILVAYSLHKRKSILYYLILIDGLMLLKAVCGTIAMIYF